MPEENEIIETELVDGQIMPLPAVPQSISTRRGYQRVELITADQVERFFRNVENLGVMYRAAELSGISYQTMMRWRKDDEMFRQMLEEAMEVYRDKLEIEAHRRAVDGWDEPVFSQKTGEQMGVVRKYDGKLLELLLKRHRHEFRDKVEVSHQVSGGVLIAPIAPLSAEDWQSQHGDKQVELLAAPKERTDE